MMMKRMKETGKVNNKDRMISIALALVFLLGLCILIYPSFSNWWNLRVTTRVVSSYTEAVGALSDEDYTSYFEEADAYNQLVNKVGSATAISNPDAIDGDYWNILDITGTGVMGYVTIDKLKVQLPIYHGTDEGVLQIAAGHLEGTSLPVGGESTHSVISAHRGLPSAKLFTDLDKMEEGDTFTVTVLNEIFTYQVDQISIVLPEEVENIYITDDEDYCTLMTCTPYGVNSHRMLVRGTRIETKASVINVTAEANQIDTFLVAAVISAVILLILLIAILVRGFRNKNIKEKG